MEGDERYRDVADEAFDDDSDLLYLDLDVVGRREAEVGFVRQGLRGYGGGLLVVIFYTISFQRQEI